MITYSDELYHHGVKGMKWGVRKKQEANAENYSTQQRVRDRKIYGDKAEKRINKRMLQGESIQSARHNEVVRKSRIDKTKAIGKRIAKGALVIGGAAAVATVLKKKGIGNSVAEGVMTEEIIGVGRQVINAMFG